MSESKLVGSTGAAGLNRSVASGGRRERLATQRIALPLALLTLAGLALRLFHIDAASFWSDELFSVYWVRNGFAYLWSPEAFEIETSPPLYYALLKPWAATFGSLEFAIRSLSALLSAASIPLVWRLAREFARPGVAWLAAALFAAMPVQVQYAQEARAYALLPLLYAVALLGLLRFMRAAPAPAYGALLAYVLAGLGLVYTHATSAFTLAALDLCTLAWLLWTRAGARQVLRLAVASLVILLLSGPEIRAILAQASRFDLAWIQRPDLIGLCNLLNVLLSDPLPVVRFRYSTLSSLLVIGLLALLLLWRARPGARAWVLLAGPALLFLAMTLGLSWLSSPFFIPRIAVWISVPLAILMAMALLSPAPALLRGAFAAALALAMGLGLYAVLFRTADYKENWRGLAAVIASQREAGDLIAIGPRSNKLGLGHYLGLALPQARWEPDGSPDMPLAPFLPEGMTEPDKLSDAQIATAARQGRQVWLVLNVTDAEDFLGQASRLVPDRQPRVERRFGGLALLFWGATRH